MANTIFLALVGGALIGAAIAGLLLVDGRIAGVSGVLADATAGREGWWRWGFLGGLVLTGIVARLSGLDAPIGLNSQSLAGLAVAGLLVGIGTRLASGCTSGHGVCGLANLSPRSLAATLVFMIGAAATVFVTHHLGAQL
jgi:uncharacterized membrane protein YedE/YeeE